MKATDGLAPEVRLALSMLILSIQDLKLENMFKDVGSMALIRSYLVITKSSKLKKQNVFSALNYIFSDAHDETYSFENCCAYLYIESSFLKKKIVTYLEDKTQPSHKYYLKWRANENTKTKGK